MAELRGSARPYLSGSPHEHLADYFYVAMFSRDCKGAWVGQWHHDGACKACRCPGPNGRTEATGDAQEVQPQSTMRRSLLTLANARHAFPHT